MNRNSSNARLDGVEKLYHYQGTNLDHLADTLRENRVRCSNPLHFNDPWDCRPYFDESAVTDPLERPKWVDFFKHQLALCDPQDHVDIVAVDQLFSVDDRFLRTCIATTTRCAEEVAEERHRIFCLTPNPMSLLMWAHYAERHRGLCLEFDATKDKIGAACRVIYADKLPAINVDLIGDEFALAETALLAKSAEWAYEEEYRILARDGAYEPEFFCATEGNYLRLPKGAITAVIAGCKAELGAVRDIIRTCAPSVVLKRAVQRLDEYHLEIIDD